MMGVRETYPDIVTTSTLYIKNREEITSSNLKMGILCTIVILKKVVLYRQKSHDKPSTSLRLNGWYLYQRVTQNTLRTHEGKQVFSGI